MKKIFISGALLMGSLAMMAGGVVTNTNMSTAYLRNPAREGAIDVDGVYFNPAGTAFLKNGIHVEVSFASAFQERTSEITYAPFALNMNRLGQTKHSYTGKATAPVIPAIHLAYNWDRWNIQAGFNIIGGGGKCKFNNGLGMFEEVLATSAAQIQGLIGKDTRYSLNQSVTGESYQYGLFIGTSYEVIKDHLSISLGAQGVYAFNHYKGGVRNMQIMMGDNFDIPAWQYLAGAAAQMEAAGQTEKAQQLLYVSNMLQEKLADIELDCRQSGFGLTPVIGIDYKVNDKLNISARWQFQTYLELKNKAKNNEAAAKNEKIGNFQDGKKIRADIPGYFSCGIQYAPIEQLRLAASYRYFDEAHAKRDMSGKGNSNEKNKGTHEPSVAIEWDIIKYVTFSCGYTSGIFTNTKDEMSELDFQLTNHSVLAGFRFNINENWRIDLGYMHTFYNKRTVTKTTDLADVPYTARFSRKNDVFGIGVSCSY